MQSLSHTLDQWCTTSRNALFDMCAHTLRRTGARTHTRVVCNCQGQSEGRRCADVLRELVWECLQCGNTFPVRTHTHTHKHDTDLSDKKRKKKSEKKTDEAQMITPPFSLTSPTLYSHSSLVPSLCSLSLISPRPIELQVECPLEVILKCLFCLVTIKHWLLVTILTD